MCLECIVTTCILGKKIMYKVALAWGLPGSSLPWFLSHTFTRKLYHVILFIFMDLLSFIA